MAQPYWISVTILTEANSILGLALKLLIVTLSISNTVCRLLVRKLIFVTCYLLEKHLYFAPVVRFTIFVLFQLLFSCFVNNVTSPFFCRKILVPIHFTQTFHLFQLWIPINVTIHRAGLGGI